MKIQFLAFILMLSFKSFALCQLSEFDYDVRGLDYTLNIYQALKQQLGIKGYTFHPTSEDYQWGHAIDQKNQYGLKISLVELYSGDPEQATPISSDDTFPIVENTDRFLGLYVTIDNLAERSTIYHYSSSEHFYRLFFTTTPLETLKKLMRNLPPFQSLEE